MNLPDVTNEEHPHWFEPVAYFIKSLATGVGAITVAAFVAGYFYGWFHK